MLAVSSKFAINVLFSVMIKVKLASVEITLAPSVQLIKVYPLLGVACMLTDAPELNDPPPLVVPPAAGFDERLTV